MIKGYVIGYASRKKPEEAHIVDVGFDHRPEKGMVVEGKHRAGEKCKLLDRLRIKIPSSKGGTHICEGFMVEEIGKDRFVIFCEAPFILREPLQGTSDEK